MKSSSLLLTFLLLMQACISDVEGKKDLDNSLESNDFPAVNREQIIDVKGDSIAAYALLASGEFPKQTVLMVKGYPGNDNNLDIAQAIRSQGMNVILFNHRGAWGSQGLYSYSNCLEDISILVDHFTTDSIAKSLRINADEMTLLGRSLGGGVALIAGSQNAKVSRIIALSSVNYGSTLKRYESLDDMGGLKRYMKTQVMMNHNIDEMLQEMLDNRAAYDVVNYNEDFASKKVLLIEDSEKSKEWTSKLTNATTVVLDSDHNFIEEREQVSQMILDFLSL